MNQPLPKGLTRRYGVLSPWAITIAPPGLTRHNRCGSPLGGLPTWSTSGQEVSSEEKGICQVSVPSGMCAMSGWSETLEKVLLKLQFVSAGTAACKPSSLANAKSPRVVPLVLRVKDEEPTTRNPP